MLHNQQFIFRITNFTGDIKRVNAINTKAKIRDRVQQILLAGAILQFETMENKLFMNNLQKIDSILPEIISTCLLYFFSGYGHRISEIFENINFNTLSLPIKMSKEDFAYKIKMFLLHTLLSYVPTKSWDGYKKAFGCIIVKKLEKLGVYPYLKKIY